MTQGKINLKVARTLQEYLDIVTEEIKNIPTPWYRGMSSSFYSLIPSLYREKSLIGLDFSGKLINGNFYKKSDAIMKSDLSAINKFIEYYQKFYPEKCKNYSLINYLYIMQHYDIPTRLLDFSTDPLIALYFAVSTAHVRKNVQGDIDKEIADFLKHDGHSESGASVHIIDPAFVNEKTSRFKNISDKILDFENVNPHILSQIDFPLCIKTDNKDPRIINQKGVFMLFGYFYKSYEEYGTFDSRTTKIFIPNSCRLAIKEELKDRFNISHSYVYPDIKGISLEIIDNIEEKYHLDCKEIFGDAL
ncbi:FRG domain-containing protein [Sphingobacterium siyangense]|uniref:FRG domain-containing protein n=1 Tax=Sphingobacterium siyangense TaxID=459529 RepID=UPI003DA1D7D8